LITKGPFPLLAWGGKDLPALIAAYFELNQLKLLLRQGWLRRGIPLERCESVGEHVFAMTLLGWWINDEYSLGLDRERVLRMILAHELGEIYTGDLIPADGIPPAEKHRLEYEGLRQVVDKLASGEEILHLWQEYAAGETLEARFVRQIDRLEMAFQACLYEAEGFTSMDEFFQSADLTIKDPALREVFDTLAALRKKAD
jgi:putative hydrolases of HD superfamily